MCQWALGQMASLSFMEQGAGEYFVQDLLGAFVTFKPMGLSPNDISSPIGKGGG